MRGLMQGFSDAFCTVEAAVFLWPGCHLLVHSVSSSFPNLSVLFLAPLCLLHRWLTGKLLSLDHLLSLSAHVFLGPEFHGPSLGLSLVSIRCCRMI